MAGSVSAGKSFPLGAHVHSGGTNFSVYSRQATGVELLLFDSPDAPEPSQALKLDPKTNHTYHYWHIFVHGVHSGQVYAFRVSGPNYPERGLRYDSTKTLLDPYGRAVVMSPAYDRRAACLPGDNSATALRSVVVNPNEYDWEEDRPLHRPFHHTVIYELHPSGFTRSPSSGLPPEKRGTYAGLIEKIPYLKELGITAVELLPVFAYDPLDAPLGRTNYWGYSSISFFAPHPGYSQRKDPLGPVDEFRDLVKALHRARIQVILDVVYNHTAEGDERGPTLCFRGFDNPAYYILEPDRRRYVNYSGTGNTLNANNPIVRRMIIDSLRYWVSEMHVDGFRFDLASILSRDEDGRPLQNPPILMEIESDPVLAGTELIAEAWDAGGLYQVGSFIGDWWKEWNGKFRDDVRSFVRGDPGSLRRLPDRLLGSPDLYERDERESEQSINFITCHDGFTLNDLVSYNFKHNEVNGEGNRDGNDNNMSWNHGVEGTTDDPQIEALRTREVKNLLTYTLISIGTPMLLMGDEARRTQLGNNNAYTQNNALSWMDWNQAEAQADLRRFVRLLIEFRQHYGLEDGDGGMKTLSQVLQEGNIRWHGVKLNQPDWSDDSHCLALTMCSHGCTHHTHILMNAYCEDKDFDLPPLPRNVHWRRLLDTSLPSPEDICERRLAPPVTGRRYHVLAHSVVVLVVDL